MLAQAPPLEDSAGGEFDCVLLAAGREAAGLELEPGDLVLFYQPKSGKAVRQRDLDGREVCVPTVTGRQGIAAIAEIQGRATRDIQVDTTEYVDGSELCWCWRAPVNAFSTDGYVPLSDVNRILGFKPAYTFGGFAYRSSGLREIEVGQYWALVEIFRTNGGSARPAADPVRSWRRLGATGPDQEREARQLLLRYVATDPTLALREAGLATMAVAHDLPAGDSADIVLEDRAGTVVAVQVETEEDRLATVAHASIRRAMLELEKGRRSGQSRVFVVSYSVSHEMRELCSSYGIECFAIDPELVRSWDGHRTSASPGS